MQISFISHKLEKLINSEQKLFKKFGDKKIVRGILFRLTMMNESDHLYEFIQESPTVRLYPLKGSKKGELAIDVLSKTCAVRIVFMCNDGENIIDDMYNIQKMKTITIITITEIGDYH